MAPERKRDVLMLALSFTAGAVDAFSFLGFQRVFTANMTGNLVLFAISAGLGAWADALRALTALAAFIVGLLAGFGVAGPPLRRAWWPRLSVAIGLEAVVLAGLAAGWQATGGNAGGTGLFVMTAGAAFAMGLQSAVGGRLSVSGMTTTYMTGTMVGLFANVMSAGELRGGDIRRAAAIICLVAGAGIEVVVFRYARPVGALLPCAVIAVAFLGAITARWRERPCTR